MSSGMSNGKIKCRKKWTGCLLIFLLISSPNVSGKVTSKLAYRKNFNDSSNFRNKGASIPKFTFTSQHAPSPEPSQSYSAKNSSLNPNSGTIYIRHIPYLPTLQPKRMLKRPLQNRLANQFQNTKFLQSQPPSQLSAPGSTFVKPKTGIMKCKGRKNLLDDIGILSLVTAVTASTFGLYTIIGNSMTSNNIGIISGIFSILLWLPSTLISLFNISGDFISTVSNFLNGLSFINSMYGFMGVLFGTADVVASTVGETIGIISFILSVVATFPDWLDSIIEFLYRVGDRRKLEYYVENYGCSVPGIFALNGRPLYDVINDWLVDATKEKGIQPYSLDFQKHNRM